MLDALLVEYVVLREEKHSRAIIRILVYAIALLLYVGFAYLVLAYSVGANNPIIPIIVFVLSIDILRELRRYINDKSKKEYKKSRRENKEWLCDVKRLLEKSGIRTDDATAMNSIITRLDEKIRKEDRVIISVQIFSRSFLLVCTICAGVFQVNKPIEEAIVIMIEIGILVAAVLSLLEIIIKPIIYRFANPEIEVMYKLIEDIQDILVFSKEVSKDNQKCLIEE